MSWDVIIFNSRQKISSIEEIDEDLLIPVDFNKILENHFPTIEADENHRRIEGLDFSIEYFVNVEFVSNKLFNLYGENALFKLINISKSYDWQIFDTGIGEMIDLEHPEKNGYTNFQNYLNQLLK